MLFLTGCQTKEVSVKNVPLSSVENFDTDTREVILIYGKRIDKKESLSNEEDKKINIYFDQYDNNPKLDKEQSSRLLDVEILKISYWTYETFSDSKESEEVILANDSIKNCFDKLRLLEKDGYKIK